MARATERRGGAGIGRRAARERRVKHRAQPAPPKAAPRHVRAVAAARQAQADRVRDLMLVRARNRVITALRRLPDDAGRRRVIAAALAVFELGPGPE